MSIDFSLIRIKEKSNDFPISQMNYWNYFTNSSNSYYSHFIQKLINIMSNNFQINITGISTSHYHGIL